MNNYCSIRKSTLPKTSLVILDVNERKQVNGGGNCKCKGFLSLFYIHFNSKSLEECYIKCCNNYRNKSYHYNEDRLECYVDVTINELSGKYPLKFTEL